jgi:hypothetical protein
MRGVYLLILAAAVFCISGCASGLNRSELVSMVENPGNAISIPHPKYIEEKGVKTITVLDVFANVALLVTEQINEIGFYPAFAIKPDGSLIHGIGSVIAKNGKLPTTEHGDPVMHLTMEADIQTLRTAAIFYGNRDGTFFYSPYSVEVYDLAEDKGKQAVVPVDMDKFDHDPSYRSKIAVKGLNIDQVSSVFERYYLRYGEQWRSGIDQVEVNSKAWQTYKQHVYEELPETYKSPTGIWSIGILPEKEYTG